MHRSTFSFVPVSFVSLSFITLLAGPVRAQEGGQAAEEPGVEGSKPAAGSPTTSPPQPQPSQAAQEDADEEEEQEQKKRSTRAPSVGLSPSDTLVSGQLVGADEGADEWGFKFRGFFRAPMRLGIGSRTPTGEARTQFHAPPVVPDLNYTTWQYSNVSPGPWAELMFQYGGSRAMMTAAIASYSITSGGWRELQAQLGIDRAFLTLNFPEALGDLGTLGWNVGVFSNRYGAPGRYDAGAYETYIIGRTRGAGEALTAELDVGAESKLLVEHGIGAKTDQQKWTPRAIGMPTSYETWEPYPGPQQQGTTLLHHAHLGFNYAGLVTPMVHYMRAWTADARATGTNPDGSMQIIGADLRLNGGGYGFGYVGFSQIKATNVNAVSDAIEVIHSQGGWQFAQNYLGAPGNGTVNTLGFQYSFSVAAFLLRPQNWWGDGADLTFSVFGMYNGISGADPTFMQTNGKSKLKWGAETLYTPLPFISFGGRFDMIQPNLDNAQRSFVIFTPRIVFRTKFVTHEQVILQYSHYSYKPEVQLPFPFNPTAPFDAMNTRDKGVFTLSASMWW